jgi:MYXO-CTERM domain-containing protein
MQARTVALVLVGLFLGVPRVASAHFTLMTPKSFTTKEDGGKGGPPCGTGPASNVVTKLTGGQMLTVTIQETTPHPGHYRIALLKSKTDTFADPAVQAVRGQSQTATIQNPPMFPVLADGVFPHTGLLPDGLKECKEDVCTTQVMIPNMDCHTCTLQVIEFMAKHGAPYFYHHCADVDVTAGGGGGTGGAGGGEGGATGSGGSNGSQGGATGTGGASGEGGATGTGGAASGEGGAMASAGGKSGSGGKSGKGGASSAEGGDEGGGDDPPPASSGCSVGGGNAAPFGLGGALLIGLALLRARRRRR